MVPEAASIQSRPEPMRKPANLLRAVPLVLALAWTGSAVAQEQPLNRVADGDFESGFVSLQLPATAPIPMFWGGWASRGRRAPLVLDGDGVDGGRSVRIVATPEDPVQLVQDLPLNGRGYGIRLAFLLEEGVQTVRLLRRGDDGQPDGAQPAFEATISAQAMRFTTPDGSWQIDVPVRTGGWHVLSVFADPRTGAQSVRFDGAPLIALPGVAAGRASTLMIGGVGGERGVFRYDAVEVLSLIDLEMTLVRTQAEELDDPSRDDILDRLSAAAIALERGSEILALPELGVARRMVLGSAGDAVELGRALDELIDLVESERDGREAETGRGAWF